LWNKVTRVIFGDRMFLPPARRKTVMVEPPKSGV
jgi:hypothetical protein